MGLLGPEGDCLYYFTVVDFSTMKRGTLHASAICRGGTALWQCYNTSQILEGTIDHMQYASLYTGFQERARSRRANSQTDAEELLALVPMLVMQDIS